MSGHGEHRPIEVRRGDDLYVVCGIEGCGEVISGVGIGDGMWYGEERALICLCDNGSHPGHEPTTHWVFKRR